MSTLKILALSGSLRQDSFNTRLLREAGRILQHTIPEDSAGFDIFAALDHVPPFNEDTEHPERPPWPTCAAAFGLPTRY